MFKKTKNTASAIASIFIFVSTSTCAWASIDTRYTSNPFDRNACNQLCAEGLAKLPGLLSSPVASAVRLISNAITFAYPETMSRNDTAISSEVITGSVTPQAKLPSVLPAPTKPVDDVFGSVALPFRQLSALKKASETFAEITKGTSLACAGSSCNDAIISVRDVITRTRQASVRDKLNAVNSTVNHAIRYTTDQDNYHEADHWASPSETLDRRQGDCEDYALLKMATLAKDGIALTDMSIVVLFDQKRHFYHAILAVTVQDHHYILDNMRDQVLLDRELPDYKPLYSISNGKGYLHGSRIKGSAMASAVPFEKIAPGEGTDF